MNNSSFFLSPPPRTGNMKATCRPPILHLVPSGIIWCLLNPIMVIKDIICAVHCQGPRVVRRLGKTQGRSIKHQIFSIIYAWAQGFLLPALFRRDPAGQNRAHNDHKALVGFQQNPESFPVLQQWGRFYLWLWALCVFTIRLLSSSASLKREWISHCRCEIKLSSKERDKTAGFLRFADAWEALMMKFNRFFLNFFQHKTRF